VKAEKLSCLGLSCNPGRDKYNHFSGKLKLNENRQMKNENAFQFLLNTSASYNQDSAHSIDLKE